MPVTLTEVPVLSQFVYAVRNVTNAQMAKQSEDDIRPALGSADRMPQALPRGVVLDKNGKPYVDLVTPSE